LDHPQPVLIWIRASMLRLAERHRRELHVHCYRMLGS
jgi:hypothetical protein